jgi:hypothetical protein
LPLTLTTLKATSKYGTARNQHSVLLPLFICEPDIATT